MLSRAAACFQTVPFLRLSQVAFHMSQGSINSTNGASHGVSLADLPKSNVFTSNLPADAAFPTPVDSFKATRKELGPRMVKGALYTYIRPEEKEGSQLFGVSEMAMRDIGLRPGEESTEDFKQLMSGNKIMWNPQNETGIYPWAQCYGGWQFGSWAGQLGDGRAISLFESTNPETGTRYELQLKGAGLTPYSRFADGKAVVRSSVREFIVSEALHGLRIPTTRALALTLTPKTQVRRERMEPGAIVCRFAQSWLRIGTFDILRARGDRKLIRKLSEYLAKHVFGGWEAIPKLSLPDPPSSTSTEDDSTSKPPTIEKLLHLNRYAHLYHHIALLNARTVAAWQAYGFTNGVLNTDNTSLLGLSLDFGPFAFLDNFDPAYTPNHDDHALRYAYRSQPSVIWWNLVRLGESLAELFGTGERVDDRAFDEGIPESIHPELIARAEGIIQGVGESYRATFLEEYKRLMTARLGLKTQQGEDFTELYSELLDTLEALELDFTHFFRRLSGLSIKSIGTEDERKDKAGIFFHAEGVTGLGYNDETARERVAKWLERWRTRVVEDWGEDEAADTERMTAMKKVNPKFIPRGWILDEIIKRVQEEGDREVLKRVMKMVERPFDDSWGGDGTEEERWCGDVPRSGRGIMCSCSS